MRVAIIGVGWVGASVAISVLTEGTARELLLYDTKPGLAEGEAMDLAHGASFYPPAAVRAATDINELLDADVVVIAAGRNGRPGQSRLDLAHENAAIVGDIASQLSALKGLIVVVTNPVDIMTRVAVAASGLPAARVLGTGTMLDTARLRYAVARELGLDARSVHALVVGEHGDSQVVLWCAAMVGGRRLRSWPGWNGAVESALAAEVRTGAYEVIKRKGATNHAIGLVTAALLKWVHRPAHRVVTVSSVQGPEYGGVVFSMPSIVGPSGLTAVVMPEMSDAEQAALLRSAEVLEVAHRAIIERR